MDKQPRDFQEELRKLLEDGELRILQEMLNELVVYQGFPASEVVKFIQKEVDKISFQENMFKSLFTIISQTLGRTDLPHTEMKSFINVFIRDQVPTMISGGMTSDEIKQIIEDALNEVVDKTDINLDLIEDINTSDFVKEESTT